MTQRLPHDDESQHGFWAMKPVRNSGGPKKVVVVHQDSSIGESIALLLGLKGFSTVYVGDLDAAHDLIVRWKPQALLLDTRFENGFEYSFTQSLLCDSEHKQMFFLAMCDFASDEPTQLIKDSGYDAMCRRPCPVWKLAELLNQFFVPFRPRT